MWKIVLNPKYEHLRDFVTQLPKHFAAGRSLRESRNSIRVCTYNGVEYNVKRYHRPHGLQRWVYSFFRQPKGLRAYRYASLITAAGVETPEEVAYVERRSKGLICETYFVCLQCPYTRRFYEFAEAEMSDEVIDIATVYAKVTAHLHEAGLMHLDNSPGNILFDKDDDGHWHIALVDTNRLYRGHVSLKRGASNFARLWGTPDFFNLLGRVYAEERNMDVTCCQQIIQAARQKFWLRYAHRHGAPYHIVFQDGREIPYGEHLPKKP